MAKTIEWKDVASDEDVFLSLKQGDNRVRLIGYPTQFSVHYIETATGSRQRVICPESGCPLCAKGDRSQDRWAINVIDRTDGKVKVLEGGFSIFGTIRDYAKDPEYGDPRRYDFNIRKSGEGMTTRYLPTPSPKKEDLTDAEKELVKNNLHSLEELYAPTPVEEIKALLGMSSSSSDKLSDDDLFGSSPLFG